MAAKIWFRKWVKYLESDPKPSECYRKLCNLDQESIEMLYKGTGADHKWGNKVQGILDMFGIEITRADIQECINSILLDKGYPLPSTDTDRRF